MMRKYFRNVSGWFLSGKLFGTILLSISMMPCASTQAQSYYYFKSRSPGNTDTTYTFLTLLPDGSATARIRAKEPDHKTEFVFEITLSDSTITDLSAGSSQIMLFHTSEPKMISGRTDRYFYTPRFFFGKQTDTSDAPYKPLDIKIDDSQGVWQSSDLLQISEYDDVNIKSQTALVSKFYKAKDPFYAYLMDNQGRGVTETRAEKMYLIVVANTDDPKIGTSTKKDYEKITTLFTKMAEDAGIQQLEKIFISGNDFSKANVEKAIDALKPSPIDIVIFYFSGHGFRFTKDKSTYARMSFRTKINTDVIVHNLSLEDVYNQIKNKHPKLTMVIGDCCNEDIGEEPRQGTGQVGSKGFTFTHFNAANARALLFPQTPKSMIIGSADVKELSVGNPALGGFFTYFFTAELYQKLYGYSPLPPDWWQIILPAKEHTGRKSVSAYCENIKARCIQTPVFEIVPPF